MDILGVCIGTSAIEAECAAVYVTHVYSVNVNWILFTVDIYSNQETLRKKWESVIQLDIINALSSLWTDIMADKPHEDELAVDKTEGFKLGEKKTIDEYQQLGVLHTFSFVT